MDIHWRYLQETLKHSGFCKVGVILIAFHEAEGLFNGFYKAESLYVEFHEVGAIYGEFVEAEAIFMRIKQKDFVWRV